MRYVFEIESMVETRSLASACTAMQGAAWLRCIDPSSEGLHSAPAPLVYVGVKLDITASIELGVAGDEADALLNIALPQACPSAPSCVFLCV